MSFLEAGELGVGCLEKWCENYFEEIKEYFDIILPHLQPYLFITNQRVAGISSTNSNDTQINQNNEEKKEEETDDNDRSKQNQAQQSAKVFFFCFVF